jgi:hypothetical protein
MIPRKVARKVTNGTCALGVVPGPIDTLKHGKVADYEIFGTGFLVRSDTILTNRHVAVAIIERMRELKLPAVHAQARFAYPNELGYQVLYCPLRKCTLVANANTDIAVIDFERDDNTDPPDFVKSAKRLSILENVQDLRLGEPIGAMGYAYGNLLHIDETSPTPDAIARYGPILQQGYISGFRPWEQTTVIDDLLLDIRSIGGMSGSPVFRRKTGHVVGVIYDGMAQTVGGESVPHAVLARAVPVDWVRLSAWLSMFDDQDGKGLLKY